MTTSAAAAAAAVPIVTSPPHALTHQGREPEGPEREDDAEVARGGGGMSARRGAGAARAVVVVVVALTWCGKLRFFRERERERESNCPPWRGVERTSSTVPEQLLDPNGVLEDETELLRRARRSPLHANGFGLCAEVNA